MESKSKVSDLTVQELEALIRNVVSEIVRKPALTIHDLNWSRAQAVAVRGLFSAFAEDWDDSSMDIYDDL